MKTNTIVLLCGCLAASPLVPAQTPAAKTSARPAEAGAVETAGVARLLPASTRHLDMLLGAAAKFPALKGKSAAAMTVLGSYLTYEATGEERYRAAAVQLAHEILAEMKATKFGVLFVKEKEKGSGEEIDGGGPPALGWYAAAVSYVCHREHDAGGLAYVGGVLDRFPWNEQGWWAATIDIKTGEPKQPLDKPSQINKCAAMALAAGMAAEYLEKVDPALAARLRKKCEACVYRQILPAQEADGFWHYNLTGRDPAGKDVYGYFMLTANVLLQLQQLTGAYRDPKFVAGVNRAAAFARACIAPMTEPNQGESPRSHATGGTPRRYTARDDFKRLAQLEIVLLGGGERSASLKIADAVLREFPFGERGVDGAHAIYATAMLHRMMSGAAATTAR